MSDNQIQEAVKKYFAGKDFAVLEEISDAVYSVQLLDEDRIFHVHLGMDGRGEMFVAEAFEKEF